MTGYIIRGRSLAARGRFENELQQAPILISAVTHAEILYGLELKPHAARLRTSVEDFLQSVETRMWDTSAAQAYAKLRAGTKTAGKALATADLLIACHALSVGAILVSHDKAFLHVEPFLAVEDWATDIP
jgi:tRNA(fMet)-specific endonuclease VapC